MPFLRHLCIWAVSVLVIKELKINPVLERNFYSTGLNCNVRALFKFKENFNIMGAMYESFFALNINPNNIVILIAQFII